MIANPVFARVVERLFDLYLACRDGVDESSGINATLLNGFWHLWHGEVQLTDHKKEPVKARTQSSRVSVIERAELSNQWAYLEQVSFNYKRRDGSWQAQRREIYHRGHGAAVLLHNVALGVIVLTKQFRFPAWDSGDDGFLLEVPAGIIESDNPAETVRQETQEETGFLIEEPQFLFRAYATPGSVTEQIHFFSAAYEPSERQGEGGGLAEEGEDIEVMEVNIAQAVGWIAEGKIIDAKTIILIQYAHMNIF